MDILMLIVQLFSMITRITSDSNKISDQIVLPFDKLFKLEVKITQPLTLETGFAKLLLCCSCTARPAQSYSKWRSAGCDQGPSSFK